MRDDMQKEDRASEEIACVAIAMRYTPRVTAKRVVQLELELSSWGGRRKGAGRKRRSDRPSVPHEARPRMRAWAPVFITLRVRDDVPDLRQPPAWASILRTFRAFRGNENLQFVHYSVLANHMHMVGEGQRTSAVSRGMQAFSTRLTKRLNATFGRQGPVLAGRYHARELATPTEVRNALRYCLLNARRHAAEHGATIDDADVLRRSTAVTFDGWRDPPRMPDRIADYGTSAARTWLLREGWRQLGSLDLRDVPGPARRDTPARMRRSKPQTRAA